MADPPVETDPEPASPEEREQQLLAQRHGDPYLMYRTPDARLQILSLPGSWDQINIGRSPAAEVSLHWDAEVSRVHAQLERLGDDWAMVDDGLSRNGSFVNGERLTGRRRLSDGDRLRVGRTSISFHAPLQAGKRTLLRGDEGLGES
jgi:FHA domain